MSHFDGSHFGNENDQFAGFSKNNQRHLGLFFSSELLYDYVTDSLDNDRRKYLENEMKTFPELQLQAQQIKESIQFCESLSLGFKINDTAIEKMKNSATFTESFLKKIHFQQWPKGLKMSLESLGLAVLIMVIGWIIPWNKIMSLKFGTTNEVILAEVNRQFTPKVTDQKHSKTETEIAFPDEGIVNAPTTSTTIAVAASHIVIPTVSLPKVSVSTTTTIASKSVAAKLPLTDKSEKSAKVTTTANNVADINSSPSAVAAGTGINTNGSAGGAVVDSKRQGFLYRGSIKIANVPAINPKLIEKLEAIGGRKAGDVPLGWRKGSGSYFHFTAPELKYEDVLKIFSEYGKVQIQREKHDRVMPEGIIRIIINVDEISP